MPDGLWLRRLEYCYQLEVAPMVGKFDRGILVRGTKILIEVQYYFDRSTTILVEIQKFNNKYSKLNPWDTLHHAGYF